MIAIQEGENWISLRSRSLQQSFLIDLLRNLQGFTHNFLFSFLLNSNLISCALLLLLFFRRNRVQHTHTRCEAVVQSVEWWKTNFLVGGARTQPSEEERKLFIAQHFGISLISAWVSGSFPKCNFPLSCCSFFIFCFNLFSTLASLFLVYNKRHSRWKIERENDDD